VNGWCFRRVIDRMREVQDGMPPGVDMAWHPALPTIPEIFDHLPKTGPGAEDLRCSAVQGLRCRYAPATPRYKPEQRELWVGEEMLRRYARKAWNQIAVLEMFESRGWPPRIEDPLGKKFDAKYAARLKKTVCRLNHEQTPWLVCFHGHEIERSITWEFKIP
jgi:hypothetical protein